MRRRPRDPLSRFFMLICRLIGVHIVVMFLISNLAGH